MVSQTDFINGPLADFGVSLTLIEQSKTLGTMGEVVANDETETAITGILMGISEKDRTLAPFGRAIAGDIKGYFRHTESGDKTVEANDIIKDGDDKRWRVIAIVNEPEDASAGVYRRALLRAVSSGE